MGVRIPWGVLWAAGTAHSVLAAALSYSFTRATGRSLWTLQADASTHFAYILVMNLVYWNGFVLLAPVALWLARRYRIDRAGWRRALPVHLLGAMAVGGAQILVQSIVRTELQTFLGIPALFGDNLRDAFLRTFDWSIAIYWGLVGLQHAVDYYSEIRERAVAASQLETRLVEAQLQALQRQLHPHFLFNTLHAISALVHRDPAKADEMIERLSDLLRLALDSVSLAEVPLDVELDYVHAYLDIEQVHFGDRLRVRWAIEPRARTLLVPNLMLQPLVENAVRHGLEPLRAGGHIDIAARIEPGERGDLLVIQIADSGVGVAAAPREGVGLGNTRARLQRLYGGAARLDLAPGPHGGTRVTVWIPCRTAHAAADSDPMLAPREVTA